MKALIFFFVLHISSIAQAYSIKLFEPKPFSLKDKTIYDETCPKNDKGEGYCNKDYNNYIRLRFLREEINWYPEVPANFSELAPEWKKSYPTNFTLFDKDSKPALEYNDEGIFFHGKKLCDVLVPWFIPHLNNKLCPAALGELPFRFTADINGAVSDFEILLKEYDEKKNSGWTMFRNEKLFFNLKSRTTRNERKKWPKDIIEKRLPLIGVDKVQDSKMLDFIKKVRSAVKEKDIETLFYTSQDKKLGSYSYLLNSGKILSQVIKSNNYIFELLDECTKGKFKFYENKKAGRMELSKGFFATGTGLESDHPIYMSCRFHRNAIGRYQFKLWITDEYSQSSNYSFSIRY